ncbi:MAG: hypothetical protein QJR02_01395 [Sinobacteraceae bacterium]|nr:hypothetical protein [Nevskiaceae bacterium]
MKLVRLPQSKQEAVERVKSIRKANRIYVVGSSGVTALGITQGNFFFVVLGLMNFVPVILLSMVCEQIKKKWGIR